MADDIKRQIIIETKIVASQDNKRAATETRKAVEDGKKAEVDANRKAARDIQRIDEDRFKNRLKQIEQQVKAEEDAASRRIAANRKAAAETATSRNRFSGSSGRPRTAPTISGAHSASGGRSTLCPPNSRN